VLARPEEGEVLAIRVRRPAAASAMDVAVFGQDDRLLARVDGYRSAGALERTG
jgi:hypothetical protein